MEPEILYGIGALLLLIALVWGVSRGRLKSRTAESISEESTREIYQEPERFDETRRDQLKRAAESAEASAEKREDTSGA
ncbi:MULTISPECIES: hypothetical protein [Hyphomonas]|uniref:hypothetical protein n=1 Tax=Hyphomonas TaxID=85 RepID=UPI0032B2F49F